MTFVNVLKILPFTHAFIRPNSSSSGHQGAPWYLRFMPDTIFSGLGAVVIGVVIVVVVMATGVVVASVANVVVVVIIGLMRSHVFPEPASVVRSCLELVLITLFLHLVTYTHTQ